jgi:tetratricopeptide (TPR) repeat protein
MDDTSCSHSSKGGDDVPVGNECSVPTSDPISTTDDTPTTINDPSATTSDPPATTSEPMVTVTVPEEAIPSLEDALRRGRDYKKEGNLTMAEKMYQRALSGHEMKHGSEHQETLAIMVNLGNLYADKGEVGRAERLYRKVLDIRERTLGPNHESTLDGVFILGTLFSESGRLEEAEQLYRRALFGYEKTLGPSHTSTMDTLNNLANLLAGQGQFDGVEDMYKRILAFYDDAKVAGKEDAPRYTTLMNLGILHMRQDNLQEAEEELQQALIGQEKWLGPNHRLTLLNVANLGAVYANMQEVSKAKQAYRRALEGFERTLGFDSPLTIMVSQNMELLQTGVRNPIGSPKHDVETRPPALDDTDSNDETLEQQNKVGSGESTDLFRCVVCNSIRNAAFYTPVNLPTIAFTDHLLSQASEGCSSCQFLESILRLRTPEVFAQDDTSFYVSWRPGEQLEDRASSSPSKIIFWVRNGDSAAGEEDYQVFEVFTLPGKTFT